MWFAVLGQCYVGDPGAEDAAYTIYQYKFAATHVIFFCTVLALVLVGWVRSMSDAAAGRHATNTINAVFSARLSLLIAEQRVSWF